MKNRKVINAKVQMKSVGPKISPFAQPSASTVGLLKLGERLTLTCAVVKGDLPLIISWTLDGRPIVSSIGTGPAQPPPPQQQNQLAVKAVQIDSYTSLLSIDSLRPIHSGNYTCSVRHPELSNRPVSQSQLVLIQGTSKSPNWLLFQHLSLEWTHTRTCAPCSICWPCFSFLYSLSLSLIRNSELGWISI